MVVRGCPGFLVNRLLMPYLNEAVLCLQAGADAAEIDAQLAREGFGWPMGPFALMDLLGLDVCHHIIAYLDAEWGDRFAEAALLRLLVEEGRLGRKSGQGFYAYDGGQAAYLGPLLQRLRETSPAVEGVAANLVDRTMAMLLNEAGTGLNVLIGLCVGHDSLFFRHSEAPVTVLVAKDRVTGHNPAAVLYTSRGYYRRVRE